MISVEDRLAIQELVARFAHYSDYRDWTALETCYVPDVVTEMEGFDIAYRGIPAQVEHAKESDRQTDGKNRHYFFNLHITEEADGVIANYYFLNTNAGGAPMAMKLVTSGRHRDTVVKVGDDWKFARRFVMFDQQFELNF